MAEPKGTNYFKDEAPGASLRESVDDEKMRLLRLVAEQGRQGAAIYNEAQRRVRENSAQAVSKSSDTPMRIPQGLLDEVKQEHDETLAVFQQTLAEAQLAEQDFTDRRIATEAVYKDSVAGDTEILADEMDRYMADVARSRRGGGGGGGGGRSGPMDPRGKGTLPDWYLRSLYPNDRGFSAETGMSTAQLTGSMEYQGTSPRRVVTLTDAVHGDPRTPGTVYYNSPEHDYRTEPKVVSDPVPKPSTKATGGRSPRSSGGWK